MASIGIESHHLRGVQAAIDLAETSLENGVELREMAYQACMSPFHFDRVFRRVVGTTPGSYVRSRRLTLAATRLLASKEPASRIGRESGYGSSEAFTRAFQSHFFLGPSEFRSYRIPFRLVAPVSVPQGGALPRSVLGSPSVVRRPALRYIGLSRRGENHHPTNMRVFYELFQRAPSGFETDRWTFLDRFLPSSGATVYEMFVGWPVETLTEIPAGLEALEVPAYDAMQVSYNGRLEDIVGEEFWTTVWGPLVDEVGGRPDNSRWKPEKSHAGTDATGRRSWEFEIPLA